MTLKGLKLEFIEYRPYIHLLVEPYLDFADLRNFIYLGMRIFLLEQVFDDEELEIL